LYCKRSYGRSKKGERAISRCPNSKGANIHVIGAISQHGLEYHERRRGSYKKANAQEYIKRLLRTLMGKGIAIQSVVMIIDNAPCHSEMEGVLREPQFEGARILR